MPIVNSNVSPQSIDLGDGEILQSNGNAIQNNNIAKPIEQKATPANEDNKEPDKIDNLDPAFDLGIKDESQKYEYENGLSVSIDGVDYTINEKHQLIDESGKVIKDAADVDSYLKGFEEHEDANFINAIAEKLNIDLVDENNNPVSFDNTPEGVAELFNEVVNNRVNDIKQEAINELVTSYPSLRDVINHAILNNGDLTSYGKTVDVSSFTIDDDRNKAIDIIKLSFETFNKKGDVDNYIEYLENADKLYEVANSELSAIKEKQASDSEDLQRKAQEVKDREAKAIEDYWNNVKSVIDNGTLGKYNIPKNIIVKQGDKNVTLTRNDFFNYLYKPNANGVTKYQEDLQSRSSDVSLNDDLIRAYLMFTKGDYSSIVDMAVNEKTVKQLKLHSSNLKMTKNNVKPTNKKSSNNNLLLD